MATSAKPRKPKKTNAFKERKKTHYRKIMSKSFYCMVTAYGSQGEYFYVGDSFAPPQEYEFLHYAILARPQHWGLTYGVACRDQLGNCYFRCNSNFANQRFYFQDPQIQQWLIEGLNEELSRVNNDHILTTFYFACPEQRELSEKQVETFLHQFKIFDEKQLLTPYEMAELRQNIEQGMKGIQLADYLDKPTARILTQNGITTTDQVYFAEKSSLQKIKGIGQTRERNIIQAVVRIMIEAPFQQDAKLFAAQHNRVENARQYLLDNQQAINQMWTHFSNTKANTTF